MVQVHPTGFSDVPKGFKDDGDPNNPLILCAEILRGVGSVLLNSKGERFVNELDTRKNVVAAMKKTQEKNFVIVLPPGSSDKVEAHVNIYTGKGLLIPVQGVEGVQQYVQKRLKGKASEIKQTFLTTTNGKHPIKRNSPTVLPEKGKYSKRRRSNVAVIIVKVIFISPFLFYCLLCNHSFPSNPNSVTNCFKLFSSIYNFTTTFAQCVRLF